ncbi:g10805 [Coccomyxa elongata]
MPQQQGVTPRVLQGQQQQLRPQTQHMGAYQPSGHPGHDMHRPQGPRPAQQQLQAGHTYIMRPGQPQGPHLQQQLGAQPLQTQAHLQGQGQVHSQQPQQQQQGASQHQGGAQPQPQHLQPQQLQPQQLQPQHLQGMPPIGALASNGVPASSAPPASSAQLQSLQSPVRQHAPRPSPKVSRAAVAALPAKKHCNCKNSRCLKLYCECFASGRYCDGCNCVNCCNNKESEQVRQAAVEAILERNPNAFRPKIQGGVEEGTHVAIQGAAARHNKGCNCKKSGCLKKYCECFQASIFCSDNCKCIDCKNFEARSLSHAQIVYVIIQATTLCGAFMKATGSDAREMVMMSLVHEHNRGGQSNVVKRARMHAQPPGTSIQPVFTGGGGVSGTVGSPNLGASTGMQHEQPGTSSGQPSARPGLQHKQPVDQAHIMGQAAYKVYTSSAQPGPQMGGPGGISRDPRDPHRQDGGTTPTMQRSPALPPLGGPLGDRPAGPPMRPAGQPLVKPKSILQETMREMVKRGGVEEMCSLLLLVAQEEHQKLQQSGAKHPQTGEEGWQLPSKDGGATAGGKALDADGDTDMDGGASPEEAAAASAPEQPAGGPGEPAAAAAARPQQPSELYEAQERAVLQEYHFILKKILDRVQKKTAADVDATAAARATASAALAAVPGNLLGTVTGSHPLTSPMNSPRPAYFISNSPGGLPRSAQASPVLQGQGLAGNVRVLHLGSPGGLQTNQASGQRMVNLSSLARPAGTGQQPQTTPVKQGEAPGLMLTSTRVMPETVDYLHRHGVFPYASGSSYRPAGQPGAPGAARPVRPAGPRPAAGPPQPSVSIVLSPRPPAAAQLAGPGAQPQPAGLSAPTITSSAAYQMQPRPQGGGLRLQPGVPGPRPGPRGLPTWQYSGGSAPGWAGRPAPVLQHRPPTSNAASTWRLSPALPRQHGSATGGPGPLDPSQAGASSQPHTTAAIVHDKEPLPSLSMAQPHQQPPPPQQQQETALPNGAVKSEEQ